jgi:hypothetical protein
MEHEGRGIDDRLFCEGIGGVYIRIGDICLTNQGEAMQS